VELNIALDLAVDVDRGMRRVTNAIVTWRLPFEVGSALSTDSSLIITCILWALSSKPKLTEP
jgi:hypothetical protein